MPARDRLVFRGSRQWARTRLEIGAELRNARREAGLSQRETAASAGLSQSELSRIELGQSVHVAAETFFRFAAAVGLRLSMKLYPDGPPVRDAGQLAVFATLRPRCHGSFGWRYEVPVTNEPDDRRAWDAEIQRPGVLIHFEVEVNVVDVQAVERRLMLKKRDGATGTLIVVVRSTHHNRRVLREAGAPLLEAFPRRTRQVLASLRRGEDPGGDGTILL